jgi:TusA-related sulfurtransferase
MPHPRRIFLDARELEHPVPLERAIQALRELSEDDYFYMIHRKQPIPLIEMAKTQGFEVFSRESEGTWHILIAKTHGLDLQGLCDV